MLQAALLLTALSKADVAFIVIGGIAAVAQGATYVTADLALCYQRHPIRGTTSHIVSESEVLEELPMPSST